MEEVGEEDEVEASQIEAPSNATSAISLDTSNMSAQSGKKKRTMLRRVKTCY